MIKNNSDIKQKLYRLAIPVLAVIFAVFINVLTVNAQPATLYYEKETVTELQKGVVYIENKIITSSGLMNIYVLKVNMSNPLLTLKPVNSSKEASLKEATGKLLTDGGALAGVNGDFFNMAGLHSLPSGLEIIDGKLTNLPANYNYYNDGSPSLFIGNDKTPFVDYLKQQLSFRVSGNELFKLSQDQNAVTLNTPIMLTYNIAKDSSALDAKFANAVKIKVRNGNITYISMPGEKVEVPSDGYLIVMSNSTYSEKSFLLGLGFPAEAKSGYTVDLSKINSAISGNAIILKAGENVPNTTAIATARHPRTAAGYTEDRKTMILMVVDGRGNSIGATFEELSWLMEKYGAFEAINLDGGGSTTMAVKDNSNTTPKVVNKPSDGSERKVANSYGIFSSAIAGEAVEIVLKASASSALVGGNVTLSCYGLDSNNIRVELPPDQISYRIAGGTAVLTDNKLQSEALGKIIVEASYKGMQSIYVINCVEACSLGSETTRLRTEVGAMAQFSLHALGPDGEKLSVNMSKVTYTVVPAELGSCAAGVFTAASPGSGYIKCQFASREFYMPVSVGLIPDKSFDLDLNTAVNATVYPATGPSAKAGAGELVTASGSKTFQLDYSFVQSDATQAAYMNFATPIVLPDKTVAISAEVYGDNSGAWLRCRIIDAKNKEYLLDFTKNINWTGFATVTANIPKEAVMPVKLDRIYVAMLSAKTPVSSKIAVGNVKALCESTADVPANTAFVDKYSFVEGDGFIGEDFPAAKYLLEKPAGYSSTWMKNTKILMFDTKNGGIYNTDAPQWQRMPGCFDPKADGYILCMDTSPLSFKNKGEYELLHSILTELYKQGKRIFVVSTDASESSVSLIDGIRYIRLAKTVNEDGTVNLTKNQLKFRINGNDTRYAIEKPQ